MPRDQRTPKQVRIGSSHNGVGFTKRNFGFGPLVPKQSFEPVAPIKRPTYPREAEIREVSRQYANQHAFMERSRRIAKAGEVGRIARFYNVYRQVVVHIRDYDGRDVIEMDIFLALKQRVDRKRKQKMTVTIADLECWAVRHIDSRERMIIKMSEKGMLVARPNAPKDARDRGGEAYTEAAAQPARGSRPKDRITVMTSLPDNPGVVFFMTLGPATKKVDGKRVPCDRRIMTVQTPGEWEAWKKGRLHRPDGQHERRRHNRGGWRHDLNVN